MPSVNHYENFPVASWLCPPRLRPPIVAIYHFARTADDVADEGEASADERLQIRVFLLMKVAQTRGGGVSGYTHGRGPSELPDAFGQGLRHLNRPHHCDL